MISCRAAPHSPNHVFPDVRLGCCPQDHQRYNAEVVAGPNLDPQFLSICVSKSVLDLHAVSHPIALYDLIEIVVRLGPLSAPKLVRVAAMATEPVAGERIQHQ